MAIFTNTAVPDKDFSRDTLLERIGARSFCVLYDLASRKTQLYISGDDARTVIGWIEDSVPGLSFSEAMEPEGWVARKATVMGFYRKMDEEETYSMDDVFSVGAKAGMLCLIFVPQAYIDAAASKAYMERVLSDTATRESSTVSGMRRTSASLQRELFSNSEETAMLKELVESANDSVLSNGMLYKAFIAAIDTPPSALEYIRSKLLVLGSKDVIFLGIEGMVKEAGRMDGLPLGRKYVSRMINFYGNHAVNYVIRTMQSETVGDIDVGAIMTGAVHESDIRASIAASALNLGTIISGLPGSGKTHLAMHMIDRAATRNAQTKIAIVSQTDEWEGFAGAHGMHVVKLCDGTVPINFFRCPDGIDAARFGDDLAMVLSAASGAGPYERPMEKCLVNAFRRVYSRGNRTPNPADVYEEIQESIIMLHGRRTNAGVRYTKHGENIKSSLEHLAGILRMPEYSVTEGVRIEELLEKGAVFDLSRASIKTKAYFYALLLHPLYASASRFDSEGDEELRMLVCVEEAQLVFGDEASAAVEDIEYRLQDFRKRGVGLMLIAHNVIDIDPGIRRLCQIKVYFKQAADVAPIAARDLVFGNVEEEDIVLKLKHMNSRIGAFSFVTKAGNE